MPWADGHSLLATVGTVAGAVSGLAAWPVFGFLCVGCGAASGLSRMISCGGHAAGRGPGGMMASHGPALLRPEPLQSAIPLPGSFWAQPGQDGAQWAPQRGT